MPALRTFTLLNKTSAQSVYTYPCNLVDFDGNLIVGAAGLYLQFHDKATAASAGNVPIKSFYIPSAGPTPLASIFQALGPVTFTLGLSIGISSTEATYTAATATFDIFGEIEEGTQSTDSISGLSTLTPGDGVSLTVQTGGTPKRLFSITIINGEGTVVYPMIINAASAPDGAYPMLQLLSMAIGETRTFYFGSDGLTFKNPAVNAVVILSSTPKTLTASLGLGSTLTAKVKT